MQVRFMKGVVCVGLALVLTACGALVQESEEEHLRQQHQSSYSVEQLSEAPIVSFEPTLPARHPHYPF